jgi:hypothetical protein
MKRVFNIDIENCQVCGIATRIIACIEDLLVVEKILTDLDKKNSSAEAPWSPPWCRAPPQVALFD